MRRRPALGLVISAFGASVLSAQVATAQQRPPDVRPRYEIGVGLDWIGGSSFGTIAANEVVASGGSFPLFSASTELGGAIGVDARIGTRVWRRFELEASGSYSRPELRSTTAGDVESAPGLTATDRLRQITVEGAVLFSAGRWRIGRATPFLSAGAGYLRQLHEGDTFAQDGRLYAFGGGARLPLVSRNRRMHVLGVRADARAVVRAQGVAPDGAAHLSLALSVSGYVGFSR